LQQKEFRVAHTSRVTKSRGLWVGQAKNSTVHPHLTYQPRSFVTRKLERLAQQHADASLIRSSDVNRESETEIANRRWLERIVPQFRRNWR
jgi:hypothetical protein